MLSTSYYLPYTNDALNELLPTLPNNALNDNYATSLNDALDKLLLHGLTEINWSSTLFT